MANHVRQQVREALATLLTGLATSASRVYQSRILPLEDSEMPALLIATNEEEIEAMSVNANPLLERSLNIAVTAVAKASANLDDTLDVSIKEVEMAINASVLANTLNGLVKDMTLQNIQVEMNAEADKPIGWAVMTFKATYYTQAAAPDISI
jgi:hypothetical protein